MEQVIDRRIDTNHHQTVVVKKVESNSGQEAGGDA